MPADARPLPSLPSLEGLRLVASVMVIALHYATYAEVRAEPLGLAVDLFFVVSGIVIAMVYDGRMHGLADWLGFMRKRVARLYPLHLATLGFYVAIGVLVWRGTVTPDNPAKYDPDLILPNLAMVHAWSPAGRISFNYVSWSISAETFVYLTFPVSLWLVKRGFLAGLLAWAATLAAALAVSHALLGEWLVDLNWRFGILRAAPSFLLGCWLWEWRDRLAATAFARALARHGFLAAGLGFAAAALLWPQPYLLLALVYAVVVSAFLADLAGRPTWAATPALADRGHLTYSLYMLHPVVATVVISVVFPRLFGRSPGELAAAILVSAVLTWIVAGLSYRWFETPLRRLIGGSGR